MEIINTPKAPMPVGPYSQAIKTSHFVYVSGQIGLDPEKGEILSNSIEDQTKRALLNVQAILEEVNCKISDVVKVTIFLKNMKDFPVVNRIYEEFFGSHKPARSCVEVSGLPKNALIEIEVIAERN